MNRSQSNGKSSVSSSSSIGRVNQTAKEATSKIPKKPIPYSYSDILKLADENAKNPGQDQKQNLITTRMVPSPKQSHVFKKPNEVLTKPKPMKSNNPAKTDPSKITSQSQPLKKQVLPGDIRYKSPSSSNEPQVSNKTQNSAAKMNSKPSVTVQMGKPIGTNVKPVQKPMQQATSAWDRVTSDIKKKKVKETPINSTQKRHSDEIDYDDDDEEYDSEMDDFIDEGDDEVDDYSEEIRKLFKYDPKRYKDLDDKDLRNMESSYHDIEREERKRYFSGDSLRFTFFALVKLALVLSAKIGYLEDLEDMRLEEEEKKKTAKNKKPRIG